MDRRAQGEPLALDVVDGVPVVRLPAGLVLFEDAVTRTADAIHRACALGYPHLLVDVRDAAFEPPTLAQRMAMVRRWAEVADGRLRIAMVAPARFVDPERFGVVAAGNFGLSGQVFLHERGALAWLQEERDAELRRGG